jgi:hypothetical protein
MPDLVPNCRYRSVFFEAGRQRLRRLLSFWHAIGLLFNLHIEKVTVDFLELALQDVDSVINSLANLQNFDICLST